LNYVFSILAAIVGLFLGNWLSLLFLFPLLFVIGKVFPDLKSSGTLTPYVSRACMGGAVSLIFWLFSYFGAIHLVLTLTFGMWVLFLSEPFSEFDALNICNGDLGKYQSYRWRLKFVRLLSYFITSFVVMGVIYLLRLPLP